MKKTSPRRQKNQQRLIQNLLSADEKRLPLIEHVTKSTDPYRAETAQSLLKQYIRKHTWTYAQSCLVDDLIENEKRFGAKNRLLHLSLKT